MSWLQNIGRWVSGEDVRERQQLGANILAEHEGQEDFEAQRALDRLCEVMPEDEAARMMVAHCKDKIQPAILAALEDSLLSPDEEARINALHERYGNIRLDNDTLARLDAARTQYEAWSTPLSPVPSDLMLKRGEWCTYSTLATAYEERQRTVQVNYAGPAMRIRIVKGLYYRAGSIRAQRILESFQHSFGLGTLAATNMRLLWVSAQKSISIPLQKIVQFEPYTDGLKVMKDTGKPVLFVFSEIDQIGMVRIARTIEELRT